jgi:HAD superfamily hydrolase (TIGR01458 family)
MTAILFDLDGVLYENDQPIAGGADAVDWFRDQHIPFRFLTNTTSKPRDALVEKLASFGIASSADEFLTPPVAARRWLEHNGARRIGLYVPEVTRAEFDGFELIGNQDAELDAVIIGDLGTDWTFDTMNLIFRSLINNPSATLIALGMTRYWRAADGLQLDVGPMVKAIEYATGRTALVTGKPAKDFYQTAVELVDDDDVFMIGDDIRGDVEAAQKAGLKAILVRTGKFTETDLTLAVEPDAVLSSIAALPQWWQENNMR